MMKKRILLSLGVALCAGVLSANATEIVKDTGNPIIVNLNRHVTRSVTFPRHLSKIITGIDTNKLSVEQSNKTLFLKPLTKNVQGDFYVTETNGRIIHLILKTTKKRNLEDIKIVSPLQQAKKAIKSVKNETPLSFLKRLVKDDMTGISIERVSDNVNINISHLFSIQITKVYEDPMYKAYYGFIYNRTDRRIRIPIENIYYKGLIGISPRQLFLNPHEKTDVYFITYKD